MNISVQNLSKSYGNTTVVDRVSFSVEDGTLLTLLGPSGCGKTTVLRMIAGLETPSSGQIFLGNTKIADGENTMPPHLRKIGMVFQSYALWPHKTVEQNITFPLEIQKLGKDARAERIRKTVELVALTGLEKRYPHELSGGQQQRVALARAIAQQPSVLLLDEPLSNLDAKLRQQMRGDLKKLQQALKLTMIYVTHDRLEALELSDHMAIMDGGRLVQLGTPVEIAKNPVNEFVRHFIS